MRRNKLLEKGKLVTNNGTLFHFLDYGAQNE